MYADFSSTVERTAQTLTPANVAILTKIAQADGLQVEYRPLIFVTGSAKETWEGRVVPAHPAAWFASYYEAERPYLRGAQQFHIREFVAATEMHFLNGSSLWEPFFAQLRAPVPRHGLVCDWDGDYLKSHVPPSRTPAWTCTRTCTWPPGRPNRR